jgi:acetylornithine deacetylase/succinyl-diaminopimelate desuccinylase-like protein
VYNSKSAEHRRIRGRTYCPSVAIKARIWGIPTHASDIEGEARRLVIRWWEDAGCSVRVDRIGNIFARRPGRDPSLAPVMTGSDLTRSRLGDPRTTSWVSY